jgi:hypothetical protein
MQLMALNDLSLKISWAVMCVALVITSPLAARSKPAGAATDRDYPSALAAANRFLQAWQMRDHETGVLMLTDAAKRHLSETLLDNFFSPEIPSHRAYEVVRGKKLSGGRYVFPVALFEFLSGKTRAGMAPRYSQIVVVKDGQAEWAIDNLP